MVLLTTRARNAHPRLRRCSRLRPCQGRACLGQEGAPPARPHKKQKQKLLDLPSEQVSPKGNITQPNLPAVVSAVTIQPAGAAVFLLLATDPLQRLLGFSSSLIVVARLVKPTMVLLTTRARNAHPRLRRCSRLRPCQGRACLGQEGAPPARPQPSILARHEYSPPQVGQEVVTQVFACRAELERPDRQRSADLVAQVGSHVADEPIDGLDSGDGAAQHGVETSVHHTRGATRTRRVRREGGCLLF